MTTPTLDANEFRKALGSFATGVTIITTRGPDGQPLGLTCSSFNSVSLNPPMVLWSLANNALSLPVFRDASHWAVHVLAADQDELSARFARRGENKFAGVEIETGTGGIPLLRGCSARFQCKTAFKYDGGDHVIFVGEVLQFDRSDSPPLVFHGGRYAHAARRDPAAERPRNAFLAGSFSEDFLGYLLGRGHFRFLAQIRGALEREQVSEQEFYVLSTLTLKRSVTEPELAAGLEGTISDEARAAMRSLISRDFVREAAAVAEMQGGEFQLTDTGRACALRLISAAKAVESHLLEQLGAGESAALKSLLNRMLRALDPEADALWGKTSGHGEQIWPPE